MEGSVEYPLEKATRLYAARYGATAPYPSEASDMERHEAPHWSSGDEPGTDWTRDYVVLRNVNGPLAVYEVFFSEDGSADLTELERDDWPETVA